MSVLEKNTAPAFGVRCDRALAAGVKRARKFPRPVLKKAVFQKLKIKKAPIWVPFLRLFGRPKRRKIISCLEAYVLSRAVAEAACAAAGKIADRTKGGELRRFVFRFLDGLVHFQFLSSCTPVAGLKPVVFPIPYKNAAVA